MGVESLVVVPCNLQLVLNAAVFEAVGALLAVVIVQQFVEALLDEFVRPSEHEQQLSERVDDQDLCALFLLREEKKRVERRREVVGPDRESGLIWINVRLRDGRGLTNCVNCLSLMQR